jgi:outer membrane receptor protein involved in Fe transport
MPLFSGGMRSDFWYRAGRVNLEIETRVAALERAAGGGIDGMTLMGNRPQTQLDNVEEIQVMKGPDGVLYGGADASMGAWST